MSTGRTRSDAKWIIVQPQSTQHQAQIDPFQTLIVYSRRTAARREGTVVSGLQLHMPRRHDAPRPPLRAFALTKFDSQADPLQRAYDPARAEGRKIDCASGTRNLPSTIHAMLASV